ncbi:nuclear transport factor 2 family protein [Streptacidiphilus carbonis]|uniref:nuclear transport factor 2 family protein n=1 Tax=Streptacidiphilus carbonis TaxID=105422 RepID=UPI0005A63E84|nr:nuclear transport factor 2 family protein [Streptacidiphilus carbonis]
MIAPRALLQAHLDAFNAGDLDALMAGFADDAVWRTGSDTAAGRPELTELFGWAMANIMPKLTVRSVVAEGESAACELTETLTHDGVTSAVPIAGFFRFRDGLIVSATVYREGSADLA